MDHKYHKKMKKQKFIMTSNTGGRSTVKTNTRKSTYRNPRRKGMKKQKITTVMSKGNAY